MKARVQRTDKNKKASHMSFRIYEQINQQQIRKEIIIPQLNKVNIIHDL